MKFPTYVVKLATGRFLSGNQHSATDLMDAQRFESRMSALGAIARLGHESGAGAVIVAYETALQASLAANGSKPSPKG